MHYLIVLLGLFIIFILFFIIESKVKPITYKNNIKNDINKIDISRFLISGQKEKTEKMLLEKDYEFVKNKILEKLNKRHKI